jgi:hypothetical protein
MCPLNSRANRGIGNRQSVIGIDAIDRGIHIGLVDQPPGRQIGVSFRDHGRFAVVPARRRLPCRAPAAVFRSVRAAPDKTDPGCVSGIGNA